MNSRDMVEFIIYVHTYVILLVIVDVLFELWVGYTFDLDTKGFE